MVGVYQLWAQTEEMSMDKICRHLFERAIVLAYDSVPFGGQYIKWQPPRLILALVEVSLLHTM